MRNQVKIDDFEQSQEAELAYWLENTQSNDPILIYVLVEQYGSDLLRLLSICNNELQRNSLLTLTTKHVISRILINATNNLGVFRGEIGIRSWLLRHGIQVCQKKHSKFPFSKKKIDKNLFDVTLDQKNELLISILEKIPFQIRVSILLRYYFDLSLEEISWIKKCKIAKVHKELYDLRSALQHNEASQPCREKYKRRIQASFDGKYGESSRLDSKIREHVSSCSDCQLYVNELTRIDAILVEKSREYWDEYSLSSSQQIELIEYVNIEREGSSNRSHKSINFREIIWTVAILASIFIGGYFLNRLDIHKGNPLFPNTPDPTIPPIENHDVPVRLIPEALNNVPDLEYQIIYNLNPQLSTDGRWLVYSYHSSKLVQGGTTYDQAIFLMDRFDGKTTQIDLPPGGKTKDGWSGYHSISSDGRWIVFSSNRSNLVETESNVCYKGERRWICSNIFLYDRITGETSLISQTTEGLLSNGNNSLPTISNDGRWIVFWSSADNLTNQTNSYCEQLDPEMECWNVFRYDRLTGGFQLVPIGRASKQALEFEILSITSDGRFVTFLLRSDDAISESFELNNESEVFVFDFDTGKFDLISKSADDLHANGNSYIPVISGDGRFLAFASTANNLVEQDTNNKADVFVRDLHKGTNELVSVSNEGKLGEDDSGYITGDRISLGGRIGISTDGRYITFVSGAKNFTLSEHAVCGLQGNTFCPNIFVRDRKNSITDQIVSDLKFNNFYLYPGITPDGRWVHLIQVHTDCGPTSPICTNIILHDRLTRNSVAGIEDYSRDLETSSSLWRPSFQDELKSPVRDIAISPESAFLAAGLDDGNVHVFSMEDFTQKYLFNQNRQSIKSLSFSPDGSWLASGSSDGRISIWRMSDGELLYNLNSYSGAVLSVDFSPDGNSLAIGTIRTAWIWDIREITFSVLNSHVYSSAQVSALRFSPDGEVIAHGLSDGTIWLMNSSNGEVITHLAAHKDGILSIAFSPDGRYLASASKDHTINLWKLDNPSKNEWQINRLILFQYVDWVNDISFSPDGKALAVSSFGSNVYMWSIPDGELLDTWLSNRWFQALSLSYAPDGKTIAVGSAWGTIKLWRSTEDD